MNQQWKPILRDVATWVCDTNADNPKFGHIQGPYATAKSVNIPVLLQATLKKVKERRDILLIVPEFRKDHVKACLDNQRDDPDVPVQTVTYKEVTDMVKFVFLEASG